MLNNYSLLPLITAFLFLIQGIFVFLYGKSNKPIRLGFLLNSCVTFWWQFSWFFLFNTSDITLGRTIANFGYVGIALIPATFFHYFYAFLSPKTYWKRAKWVYLIGFIFILFIPSNFFINGVNSFYWGYYPKAGLIHPIFLIYLFTIMAICVYKLLMKGMKIKWQGIEGTQLNFLLTSFLVYCIASADFLVNYGFPHYPIGVIAILVSLAISAYAIVRHRLMDIRLAISNMAIFIIVYTLVLGFPLYFGYRYHLWQLSTWAMLFLATAGPMVLGYFQKQAEQRILEDQRRYQETLKRASKGIRQIKSIEQITKTIVHIIHSSIGLKNTALYLRQENALKLKNKVGTFVKLIEEISADRLIIEAFTELGIFFTNEIDFQKFSILAFLKDSPNYLFVPIIDDKKLLALLILGEKVNGTVYSSSDLDALSYISDNMALVIENAQYRKDEIERLQESDALQRRQDVDAIMAVMAHEIRTPNGAVIMQAEAMLMDIEKSMDIKDTSFGQKSIKKLKTILKSAETTDILIDRVKRFTQVHDFKIVPFKIPSLLEDIEFLLEATLKKYQGIVFTKNISETLPNVLGDEIMVEQIILNYISNAAHAVANNKNDPKEITLNVSRLDDRYVRIEVVDNGYGIPPDILKKLFHVPTTTKINKDGSGLGLWNIHRMSERINGYVGIHSDGEGKGSRVWLDLMIAS